MLVSGATGQLGMCLQDIAHHHFSHRFYFLSRALLDITDGGQLQHWVQKIRPHYFVNAAAFTAVDGAESEPEKCMEINASAVKDIADVCANNGTKIIHFSSDYVYDNGLRRPLEEGDPTDPKGIYAKSKLQGENFLKDSRADYLIIRTSWVFSEYGNNFVKTMHRLGETHRDLKVVADQIGNPTYAGVIANVAFQFCHPKWDSVFRDREVFNLCQYPTTHWADFAEFIMKISNKNCHIIKYLPLNMELRHQGQPTVYSTQEKIESKVEIKQKDWRQSVKKVIGILESQNHE